MTNNFRADKLIAINNDPCGGDRHLTEYKLPTCADCKHFRPYYLKQANGSYKAMGCLGGCAKSEHTLGSIGSMTNNLHPRANCQTFEPIDTDLYQQIWLKTPAN